MEDQSRSGHRASIIDLSLSRTPSTLGTSVKYAVSRIDTIFNTCFDPQDGLRTLQTLPVNHSSELPAPLLCPLLAAEDGREDGGRGPHLDRWRVDISTLSISTYLHIYRMPHRVAVHGPEHECELAPDCLHRGGVQHHQGQEADTVPVQTQVLNSSGVETLTSRHSQLFTSSPFQRTGTRASLSPVCRSA